VDTGTDKNKTLYALYVDLDGRIKRAWTQTTMNLFIEIEVKDMVKKICEYLSRHVTLEKLLQDKLLHEGIETILDLHLRVENKGKVKEKKGCYSLKIGGKAGRYLEVQL